MTEKRFIFLVLSIFFSATKSFSQTGTESILWRNPIPIYTPSGTQIMVLNFDGALYSSQNSYLPTLTIEISNAQSIANFAISNAKYAPLTAEELSSINKAKIPSNYGIHISRGIISKVPVSIVSLIPITYNPSAGGYEKLVSFQYSYQIVSSASQRVAATTVNYTSSSVLASGSWYKLAIPSTGMYKIDYNFLKNMGIDPASVDPNTIRLFGNGGGMLPQPNKLFRYDDLQENSIYVSGANDGKFDPSDYVLFYGTGPDTWSSNLSGQYTHIKNIYSDNTYYFLTYGGVQGLRISNVPAPSAGGTPNSITTYTDYAYHENESINLLHSGRLWFGETLSEQVGLNQAFSFNFPGIVKSTSNKVLVSVAANLTTSATRTTAFQVSANTTSVGTIYISSIAPVSYQMAARGASNTFSLGFLDSTSSSVNIELNYNPEGNSSAVGYLDYIELNIVRKIGLYGNQSNFRCLPQTSSPSVFTVNNVNDPTVQIWDVTIPVQPQNQPYTLAGNGQAIFTAVATANKEYIVFLGNQFSNPSFVGQVTNQNLHGITSYPELAVITPKEFAGEAAKLQSFKNSQGITTGIYYLDEIYNEFSSGAQDITAIRDFARMLYNKSNNFKYLLLFGDCSYDYKNRVSNNTNIVPVYESNESYSPTSTYSSDDYYGLLDSTEGEWPEVSDTIALINELMDIGVGRFTVKDNSEADAVVSKIIHYSTDPNCLGKWRNQIAIVADNDPNPSDPQNINFTNDAESQVATYLSPLYNVDKLYMDAYPLVSTPNGNTCPELTTAIEEEVAKGALILDYLGHGGETIWAQEYILNTSQISQWTNYNNLPFFITATCDFGRYDDPDIVSGSEMLLTLSQGGGIGSLSSTRPVFQQSNNAINTSFIQNAFTPVNKIMPLLGDIMKKAKNKALATFPGGTTGNRNYALLGDPSLTLAYPSEWVNITKINTVPVTAHDTLKALEKVTLSGEIRSHLDSSLVSNFNGTLFAEVLDKPSEVITPARDFYTWNNFLYEGSASVVNGTFTLTFIVPKDIAYNYGKGKISLYARRDGTTGDAHGIDTAIVVGGSVSNAPADVTPPTAKLYMQDTTFVSGGLTGSNTVLIAHLSDANGINVSGEGIGHGITAVLDGNTQSVINLNNYYSANKDSYTSGTINFPINGLSPGMHTIQLTAWDTYDNSVVTTIEFEVANTAHLALQNVINYPNPFSTSTTFHFDHNREGDDMEVLVQIYTVSGNLVHTIDEKIPASTSHIVTTEWNGRDNYGDKLAKGVYVYKLRARSLRDGSDTFKYQKLVILN